jgi:hypothetical protein
MSFITEQNIARFRRQLLTPKDEDQRKMLVRLLAEEEAKEEPPAPDAAWPYP